MGRDFFFFFFFFEILALAEVCAPLISKSCGWSLMKFYMYIDTILKKDDINFSADPYVCIGRSMHSRYLKKL